VGCPSAGGNPVVNRDQRGRGSVWGPAGFANPDSYGDPHSNLNGNPNLNAGPSDGYTDFDPHTNLNAHPYPNADPTPTPILALIVAGEEAGGSASTRSAWLPGSSLAVLANGRW